MALALVLALAGCSSTIANLTEKDPEMDRPGFYPNINETGGQPPGALMSTDQQTAARHDLEGRASRAANSGAARTLAEQRAAGAELERRAETHGAARLREIECESGNADATKCPQ